MSSREFSSCRRRWFRSTSSSFPFHFRTLPATITVSTLVRSISETTAPGTLLSGATLIAVASRMMMSASLPGVSEPVLPSSPRCFAPLMVANRSTSRTLRSGGVPAAGVGHWLGGVNVPCSRIIWFTTMRCMVIAERIWVKKSAVIVTSTSELRDGSMPRLCILRMGGMPCRMFISIGKAIETCTPLSLTACQPLLDIPVMWMNRLSGPSPMSLLRPAVPSARSSRIGRIRREDVRRNLETELAPDLPRLCVGQFAQVDLAAHDHVDELIIRGEPLLFDAGRVTRILVAGNATGALEIAERGAAARIEQGLDRGVGVRRRVMDLRDIVHRRDAVIELRQSAE